MGMLLNYKLKERREKEKLLRKRTLTLRL
nr:unnamed protein product [Callosobruchus chinensis]